MADAGTEAIEVLFASRYTEMLARARAILRSEADAKDAIQDAMISVLGGPHVLTTVENIGAWLLTLVYRRCVDIVRRESRRREAESGIEDLLAHEDLDEVSDLAAAIARAVEELPADLGFAFVENALEGRTFKEISRATGIPMGTLMARKKRAVDRIRERLEKEELP